MEQGKPVQGEEPFDEREISESALQTIWKSLDYITEEYGYQTLHEFILSQQVSNFELSVEEWYDQIRQHVKRKSIADSQEYDPRVNEQLYDAAYSIARRAERLGFERLRSRLASRCGTRIFIGTTSGVEDHIVTADGVCAWIQELCKTSHDAATFKNLVIEGPSDGDIAWANPKDIREAVAGICRIITLRQGQKCRLRFSETLRSQLRKILCDAQYQWPRSALGGVAAFTSQTALAFQHKPTMHALGTISAGMIRRGHLPPSLPIITEHGRHTTLGKICESDEEENPGHYTVSLRNFTFPAELWGITVCDRSIDHEHAFDAELLITGAQMPIGFGMPEEALETVGKEHHISLITGYQYLQTKKDINDFFNSVTSLSRGGNPVLLEYSPPRGQGVTNEMYAIRKIQETPLTLISINTSEAYDLLERLSRLLEQPQLGHALGLSDNFAQDLSEALELTHTHGTLTHSLWRCGKEDPRWIYASAQLLLTLTNTTFMRVRGMHTDVTVTKPNMAPSLKQDAEQLRNAIFFCRQMAALKVALVGGNFRGPDDIAPVEIVPNPSELVAHSHLGDAVAEDVKRLKHTPESAALCREDIIQNWYTHLPNGQYVFAGLPQEFRVRDGGSQSAGDTMAIVLATDAAKSFKAFIRKRSAH